MIIGSWAQTPKPSLFWGSKGKFYMMFVYKFQPHIFSSSIHPLKHHVFDVSDPHLFLKNKTNHHVPLWVPVSTWAWKLPLEYEVTHQKKAYPPFYNSHQLPVAPQLEMELCHLLPHPCWDFGCLDLLQDTVTKSKAHSCNCAVMSDKKMQMHNRFVLL